MSKNIVVDVFILNERLDREWKQIDDSMTYFIGRPGPGSSIFGETAKLEKLTKQHLVFRTESGTIVRADDLLNTVGKAKDYFVVIGDRLGEEDSYKSPVML